MATLNVTEAYTNGNILFQSELDGAFNSVEAFLNSTGLNADNINNGVISQQKMAVAGISTAKINNAAITGAKIAVGTIAEEKLAADAAAGLVKPGMILPYAGVAAPSGWFICDGSTVSRTTYADLFAVIGTSHGNGDGTTTFHLPDLRGRFIRGRDAGTARDPDAGSRIVSNAGGNTGDNVGSLQADAVGTHTHSVSVSFQVSLFGTPNNRIYGETGSSPGTLSWGRNFYSSAETRPKNVYETYIIKI